MVSVTKKGIKRLNSHGFYSHSGGSEFFHEHNPTLSIFINCKGDWVFNTGWSPDFALVVSDELDGAIEAYFKYRDKQLYGC